MNKNVDQVTKQIKENSLEGLPVDILGEIIGKCSWEDAFKAINGLSRSCKGLNKKINTREGQSNQLNPNIAQYLLHALNESKSIEFYDCLVKQYTILKLSGEKDNYDIVKKIDDMIESKDSALFYRAAANGNLDIIKRMLNKGININARFHLAGGTALMAAAQHEHKEVVEFLIKNGADITLQDYNNNATLVYSGNSSILSYLKDVSEKSNASIFSQAKKNTKKKLLGSIQKKLLEMASRNGKIELLKTELKRKDINATLLKAAAEAGQLAVVEYLVENGAFDAITYALKSAAEKGQLEVVKYLACQGADTYSINRDRVSERISKWLDAFMLIRNSLHYNTSLLNDVFLVIKKAKNEK